MVWLLLGNNGKFWELLIPSSGLTGQNDDCFKKVYSFFIKKLFFTDCCTTGKWKVKYQLIVLIYNAIPTTTYLVSESIPPDVGQSGGQVVSVLVFSFNDPSLNPSEVCNLAVKFLLKRTKIITEKRPVLGHKKSSMILSELSLLFWRFINTAAYHLG